MDSPGQALWAKILSVVLPIVGAVSACLWGGWSEVLTALSLLVLLDIASGVYRAICQQQLSSNVSWRGMVKKVGIYLVVAVAHIVGDQLGFAQQGRDAAAGAFCVTEALSVIENVGAVIPIPDWLRDVLVQLKEKKFVGPPDDATDKPGDTPGPSDGAP